MSTSSMKHRQNFHEIFHNLLLILIAKKILSRSCGNNLQMKMIISSIIIYNNHNEATASTWRVFGPVWKRFMPSAYQGGLG